MTNRLNHRILRTFVGGFAWPTVALALGTWAVFFASCYLFQNGSIHPAVLTLVAVVCNFYSFTVFHEAAHENIEGKSRGGWLTTILGYVGGAMFMAPFDAVRRIHLTHHQYTNDPARDPDHWVAGSNLLAVALRCLTIYPNYLYQYLFKLEAPRRELVKSVVFLVAYWGLAVSALFSQYAELSLYGVIIPTFLGTGVTALLFDWLPHHPHQETSPVSNTRNFPSLVLSVLLAGQNVHGVHHLNPRIPFHRYQRAYDAATAPVAPGKPEDKISA
jgi:fatty acid desaturase